MMPLRKIIISAIAFLVTFLGQAQENNVLYFMKGVPQSQYLNPAFQPNCKFYIATPAVGTVELYGGTNLRPIDLIFNGSDGSTTSILDSAYNKADFVNKLKAKNYIYFYNNVHLFSFGFRARQLYFNFDYSVRNNYEISYPKDLFRLSLLGLEYNQTYDFSGLGANVYSYNAFSAGVSRNFFDQFTIGIRGSFLTGMAGVQTENKQLSITNSSDGIMLRSNATIMASTGPVNVPLDSEGKLNLDSIKLDDFANANDYISNILGLQNKGFAFDLGATYQLTPKIQLYGSLLDLGQIHWKRKLKFMRSQGEYLIQSLEINSLNTDSITKSMENLGDTLLDHFDLVETGGTYTTHLTPKLYVGATFNVTERVSFGLLSRTYFYDRNTQQQFTLSANVQPINFFSLSLAYSFLNQAYNSLGVGMAFKVGPSNCFFTLDQIPLTYSKLKFSINDKSRTFPAPTYNRGINIRFGACLMFGGKKLQKAKEDQPILEEED
jgi:hypothetical protein